MASVIRIKRRIGTAGLPTPADLSAAELAYHRLAAAGAADNADNLYVGDGVGVHALVSSARQVELAGAQTVTGLKTFATGATPSIAITGGANGNILSTTGGGVLAWIAAPPATVQVDDPITGDGAGTPLTVTPATIPQIIAGVPDNVFPITSAGLRNQMGAPANALNLGTTATTVVPAIREHSDLIAALGETIHLMGTYNGATNRIENAVPPAVDGLLPAPAAGNAGWVFIVTVAGTGIAPAPIVPLVISDWLVSTGTGTEWLHIDMGLGLITAANVNVTAIPGMGAIDNVQDALEFLQANKLATVAVDGTSIIGDGTVGNELEIDQVDAGTY